MYSYAFMIDLVTLSQLAFSAVGSVLIHKEFERHVFMDQVRIYMCDKDLQGEEVYTLLRHS